MNNQALENFLVRIDGEETKNSKETKATNSISDTAKSMKLELEEGLKEIDQLDPIERSCGLIALRKKMGLGVHQFEKLVENLVRMTEDKPPRKFSELKAYKKKKHRQ